VPNEFLDRVRSIGFPRRSGQSETRQVVEDGRVVATEVEHWDGRQDATVYPDVVRYGTRVHRTGRKRGEVAEVHTLGEKERRERYGDGG
jgi:hypothetical protein